MLFRCQHAQNYLSAPPKIRTAQKKPNNLPVKFTRIFCPVKIQSEQLFVFFVLYSNYLLQWLLVRANEIQALGYAYNIET